VMSAAKVATTANMSTRPAKALRTHLWSIAGDSIWCPKHGRVRLRHMGWMDLLERRGQRS